MVIPLCAELAVGGKEGEWEAQLQPLGWAASSLRDSGRWPSRCQHQPAPAQLQTCLALPSQQTLAGIFGSSQRGVGAEAPEQPCQAAAPIHQQQGALCCARSPSRLTSPCLAPTGTWFLQNSSLTPLDVSVTPELVKGTTPAPHPPRAHKLSETGRKPHANLSNIKVSQGWRVRPQSLQEQQHRDTALLLPCLLPVLWHKVPQGCSGCL